MNLIGMEVGNLRLPLGHMQPNNLELLKKELKCARFELKQFKTKIFIKTNYKKRILNLLF